MSDDVIPCQTMSELCLFMNLTYHALCTFKLCIGLPVGLYVMHEGLPVTQRVCLSCATTAIVTHMCCNDIMMQI